MQPGKGQLANGTALALGDAHHSIDQCQVLGKVLLTEPRLTVQSEIMSPEFRGFPRADRASKEASSQRGVGHNLNNGLEVLQDHALGQTLHTPIFVTLTR